MVETFPDSVRQLFSIFHIRISFIETFWLRPFPLASGFFVNLSTRTNWANSTPFDNLIDPLKQVSLTMPCCLRGADIFWGSIKSWVNISGQLGYWQAIAHPSLVVLPWMIVLDVQWIFAEKYCCVFKMKLRSIRLLLLLLLLLPQILHFTKRRWRQCRECQNHKMDCTIFDKAGRHSSIS